MNGASNYPDCNQFPGCTDPNAKNYDPNAVGDDGSCTYENCDDEQKALDDAINARIAAKAAYEEAGRALYDCRYSINPITILTGCDEEQQRAQDAGQAYDDAIVAEDNARQALLSCENR